MRRLLAPANVPATNKEAAVSVAIGKILIWPSGKLLIASRTASFASAWMTDAPPSAFGSMIASGFVGAMASRSASVRPVCRPFTRTIMYGRGVFAMTSLRNSAALSRARVLPSSAIESSRSTISASAPLVIALSSFLALSAGTKRSERIVRVHVTSAACG